jgi:hypothetical protein
MFGESGKDCHHKESDENVLETPWTILGNALDALVTDKVLPAQKRQGAELKAWSVVHGYASLSIDGLAATSSARQRTAALEALLDFTVIGLVGALPPSLTPQNPPCGAMAERDFPASD